MFFYTTGDLLQSDAEALVNTVNCEGYMGKGIAYQLNLNFQIITKTMSRRVKMAHSVQEIFMSMKKAVKLSSIFRLKINGVRNPR